MRGVFVFLKGTRNINRLLNLPSHFYICGIFIIQEHLSRYHIATEASHAYVPHPEMKE